MSKGFFILYRVFGAIMNLLSYLTLFLYISLLFEVGLQQELLAPLFVSACMVIYTTLSRLFSLSVLKNGKPMRRTLKDWIIANAVVSVLALGFTMFKILALLTSQSQINALLAPYNAQLSSMYPGKSTPVMANMVVEAGVILLVILFMALTHCIWTLFLVRRNKDYFQ
jgi:hypothetical protein